MIMFLIWYANIGLLVTILGLIFEKHLDDLELLLRDRPEMSNYPREVLITCWAISALFFWPIFLLSFLFGV